MRGKLALDPVFAALARVVHPHGVLLDAGCGFGLPAVWLAALYPDLVIEGFDSHPRRVRIARHALGTRGTVQCMDVARWAAGASDGRSFTTILCIDVLHQMPARAVFLEAAARRLRLDGALVLRTTVIDRAVVPARWSQRIERVMVRLRGQRTAGFLDEGQVRTLLDRAGFRTVTVVAPPSGRGETLFVARVSVEGASQEDAVGGDAHVDRAGLGLGR